MKILTASCLMIALTILSGCASEEPRHRHHDSYSSSHRSIRAADNYGVVTDIDLVSSGSRTSGGGAVLGAVIGGVIGHQVGSGRGNDVATGLGAVGGAVAGNNIEKRRRSESEVYRVTVRLHNGDRVHYDYDDIGDLQVGDKVRVENDQLYVP